MGVVYQRGPSRNYSSQNQQQHHRQTGSNATGRFIGLNLAVGLPLAVLFGFTMPFWSLAAVTVSFAISVLIVAKAEGISNSLSLFYNLIVSMTINTIGVILFGGLGIQAVFLTLAGYAVLNVVLMSIGPTRSWVLSLARGRIGQWVGYVVSTGATLTLLGTIISYASPLSTQVEASLKTEFDTLSQNISISGTGKGTVVYPFEKGGRTFLYVSENGAGKIIWIPLKSYSSYYDRVIALLTHSHLDHNALLVNKPGLIHQLLDANGFLQEKESPVVIVDGNLDSVNFNQEFSTRTVLRSVSTDTKLIQRNMALISNATTISPKNTRLINGIPGNSTGLRNIDVDDDWQRWDGIRSRWQSVISQNQYEQNGNSRQDVLSAVESGYNVLIVVAHSDGNQILFPDGSQLKIGDFKLLETQMQQNHPIILLFGCEAARIENEQSFAKGLIDLGAQVVVAPTTKIGAVSSSALLDQFLKNSASGQDFLTALKNAMQGTKIYELQNWIGGSFSNKHSLQELRIRA